MRKLLLFLLTVLVVLIACALVPWQAPKPALAPVATFTPIWIDPSTPTPAATATTAPTATKAPTLTPTSTSTPVPTATLTPTQPPPPLAAQPGTPRYLPAFAHADLGCAWLGAAGQVFGPAGEGIPSAVVIISGVVNGQTVEGMALTGVTERYGAGGFEIDLSPYRALGGSLVQIQVFDLRGTALSDPVSFALPASCAENLALVNFSFGIVASTVPQP